MFKGLMEKVFRFVGDEVSPGFFTDANFGDTSAAGSMRVTHCTSE